MFEMAGAKDVGLHSVFLLVLAVDPHFTEQ